MREMTSLIMDMTVSGWTETHTHTHTHRSHTHALTHTHTHTQMASVRLCLTMWPTKMMSSPYSLVILLTSLRSAMAIGGKVN